MFTASKRATRRTPAEGRCYILTGLVHCALCKRRMQGHWNHDRPYYRCKFPDDYPVDQPEHPKSVYVQEKAIITGLDRWLATIFDDDHIDDTCELLAGSAEPDRHAVQNEARLRQQIKDCDRWLESYRSVLDQGGEVATVAKWISETERERKALVAQLGRPVPGGRLTTDQIKALVGTLRDIVDALANAEPADKAEAYRELDITLSYSPDRRVKVQALPRGVNVRVGGPSRTLGTRSIPRSEILSMDGPGQRTEGIRRRLDGLAQRELRATGGLSI